jgi:hypothetical protein
MEGKILIAKSFGISQLIYNMQSYSFKKEDKINIEREIFKFLWSTPKNQNGIDRIKRSVMKNDIKHGGMNMVDIECLDRALKLRQFLRASKSKHVISKIQELLCGKNLKRDYYDLAKSEPVCSSAQDSINVMTDYNRSHLGEVGEEDPDWIINVEEMSSINVQDFLKRRNRVFHACMMNKLNSLGELVRAYEHESDQSLNKLMKIILVEIPSKIITITSCFDEDRHTEAEEVSILK